MDGSDGPFVTSPVSPSTVGIVVVPARVLCCVVVCVLDLPLLVVLIAAFAVLVDADADVLILDTVALVVDLLALALRLLFVLYLNVIDVVLVLLELL